MKNFFKRLTAMLLVAIMVAPQFQLPSFAWEDQYEEWFKSESNLNYWRADSTSTYTENGTTYISTKGPVKQSAFNSTVTFDENAGYTTFGHYVHAAHDAVGSNTHAVMNGLWVPYTSSRNVTHINPPIADSDGDGDREINLKGLNGSIYTYDTLTGPYNFSFKMKVDKAPARPQDALWAFFRGDEGDFQTDNSEVTFYDQVNADGSLGGSGLAFFVSGDYALTLIIKTAKSGHQSKITYEPVTFVTKTKLTGAELTYTVMDTGMSTDGHGNYIYLMVTDSNGVCEPICYIRATGLFQFAGVSDNPNNTQRLSYVTSTVDKASDGKDKNKHVALKVNYDFDNLQNDNSYYFRNLLVYSPTGIIVHESFNALVRNYSRLALAGCDVTSDTYIDDIEVEAYNRDAFETAAQEQIDTAKGIYLPITIRDFAGDSVLFEWTNNIINGEEDWNEQVKAPTAVVSTHSSNLIGHRWIAYDSQYRTYFSHYFNFLPGGDEYNSSKQPTNNNTVSAWREGWEDKTLYRYRDYDIIYSDIVEHSVNTDGSLRVKTGNNGSTSDPWIRMGYGNSDIFSRDDYTNLTIAFKPADRQFVDGEEIQIFMFSDNTEGQVRRTFTVTLSNTLSECAIKNDDTALSGTTLVKCNEEGYKDYYILTIPSTHFSSVAFSDIRIDFDSNNLGLSYDLLYVALLNVVGYSRTNSDNAQIDVGVTSHHVVAGTTLSVSNGESGDLYSYYRVTQTAEYNDVYWWLKNVCRNSSDNTVDNDAAFYGSDEKPVGYVYLRYRVPQIDGKSQANYFFLRDSHANVVASSDYIQDGNWHDLIIPIKRTWTEDTMSMRFDPIRGSDPNSVVDISTLRYIPACEFKYGRGYNSDLTEQELYKDAAFAAAANGVKGDKGHLQASTSKVGNWAYFSYESYTANGRLPLYDGTVRSNGSYGEGISKVSINTSTAKFLQLRYRTNSTNPVTLYFTHDQSATPVEYELSLKADGTWNTRVVELKLPANATVTKIEAKYSKLVTEGGEQVEKDFWLEIGDLNFYENRNSAWYYNGSGYKFADKGNDCPYYAGFGFEQDTRIWRDLNGDGVIENTEKLIIRYYPGETKNTGIAVHEALGSGYDQQANNTFVNSATGNNGEVMSHAVASQGLLENTLTNGKPRYTYRAVSFIAKHLELILPIEPENEFGYKEYAAFLGEESMLIASKVGVDYPIEMREALLLCINKDPSKFSTDWEFVSSSEIYNGEATRNYKWNTTEEEYASYRGYATFAELKANAATNDCFDLAYFLLHNLFTDAYGEEIYEYNALKLIQGYGIDGTQSANPSYTFDTNRDATAYEPTGYGDGDEFTGLIYNTQAATADGGHLSTRMFSNNIYDFDPLGSQRDIQLGKGLEGAEQLGLGNSTYGTVDAMKDNNNFYRNFHYTMQGSAEFIYRAEQNQYFDFIGDDDVYLFIDDTLVLDVGGAHLPSRGVIYLNKLVENRTLDLVDGNEYTFEFFYMERHYGDANISINTNIELSVPAIDVVKDGYQKDSKGTLNKLQYGDNIIEGRPVIYEFSLTNTTDPQFGHVLSEITFVDNDLGVTISKDGLTFASGSTAKFDYSDAYIKVTNKDGTLLKEYDCKDESDIKTAFTAIELKAGETVTIRGVSYTLPTGTETFHNTVTGIATYYKAYNDDGTPIDESVATLTDTDDFLVNVSEMHVYVQKDVERQFIFREIFDNSTRIGGSTYGELKNQAYFKNSAYIQLCDGYKKPITNIDEIHFTNNSLQLSTFETNTSNNAYLTTDATGLSTFMFTVNYNEPQPDNTEIARSYGPYYVAVYSYAFEDKNYVLDYGLPVVIEDELNASTDDDYNKVDPYIDQIKASEASAQALDSGYDVFVIADNPEETGKEFLAYSNYSTLKYGSLNIDDATQATKPKENLTYTPNKFIEGRDSFNVTVGVYEKEIDDDNLFKDNVYHITNGVQMTKTVSFVPASVMYYEESIGSISLRDTENKMTFGSASLNQPNTQSANQSYNYGYDPEAYKDDPDLSTGIANATFSWYGKAAISCGPVISTNGGTGQYTYNFSNGTYAHLNTNPAVGTYNMKTACVKFTFTGTGFDVISTTDLAAAMINVIIYARNDDGTNGTVVSRLPVNCTYTNGTLSQVPVFSKKNLSYGTYNVEIFASKPYNTYLSTDFYLDGIRIYNPAEDYIVDNEYLDDEKDVEFNSIRDMILTAGTVAVSQISLDGTGDELITTTGVNNSVVEHIHDANGSWGSSNDVLGDSYHDDTNFKDYAYDAVGPKNECYLSYGTGLVMSITKTADISTLQVEARLIDQGTDDAKFKYVICEGDKSLFNPVTHTVKSYTAMYFDIDLSSCEVGKTYNIAFGPSADGNRVPVCFTNVKSKGIAFADFGTLGTDGKYDITGDTYNSILTGLKNITGIWNVGNVTSDSIVIHKASTATNTAAGTISFKVQTSHNAKRVEIWEGNTKIAESTTANTFGSIKLFTVKVTGLDLTENHNFTVKAFNSETGGTAVAENKTVSYTASGAVTVVDGTLLYYEDFESSTYTDKTNDNLMGALGWPGADSYADVNNPAYGIYKDTTTGNKALSITGYNTTASRTLLSILTPEQMKPYYGTGKIITLQYDLMYTDNNSDPSKFFSISPAFNSVDNKYIFPIIRYSGKANNDTVTDNYSGGSSITASSTNLKNKQISVRNVLDWSANTNTLYVKGHDNTGNWKILSTIDLSASPETFAGGITLITGGKQNGYIDNIMVWTGNAGTNAEPTDKTDPVLQPDTSKGETTVPNGTLLYYQNFESDKYTGTDNSLLQTLGWTNKSGTTDNYSTYSIYTDSATGNKALNITKAKTEDSTLNRAFVEILSSDAMESYYGSNKAVTVQYDFVYTEGNSGNFFTVSPAYNSTNNKNIFVVIRNTGEDGINAAEKGNNGGLYQFDSKISAKDKLNVSDMNNQSFSVRHILDWQSRKSIIYIRSNGSADNSWKLYSSATIDPEINPEDMGGGIALVSGNFQSGYVDNIMVWTGNAGTGDEPTDKRNQILQPEFDIGSEPVG